MKKNILIFLILLLILTLNTAFAAQISAEEIIHLKLNSEINNAEFSFLDKEITAAEERGVELLILEINSLGGYVDPALKIRDRIFNSKLEIVTFVNGRAWSAAALIALTGQEMYISPSSSIGAAETRPKEEKYISALRKEFASTAEKRNKDPQLAAAMVDADIEIEGIIAEDKLLSLTAAEALEYKIADFSAGSLAEIAELKDINFSQIKKLEKSNFEKIMTIISSPYLSSLILVIAFSALIFEALTPGFALGGSIGIIALLLFFSSHIYIGAVGAGIVALFIVGIILILAEIFIIPGFGIAGISGITAILISIFFVFPNPVIAVNVLLAVLIFTFIIAIFMFKKFDSSRFWRKISLETNSKNYYSSASKKDYLDQIGITISKLRPAGTIEIDGKRVDAVSEGDFIEKGKNVRVISVSGARVVVKEILKEE